MTYAAPLADMRLVLDAVGGLDVPLHKVRGAAPVDVHVDETRDDQKARGIDIRRPAAGRRLFVDLRDRPAVVNPET